MTPLRQRMLEALVLRGMAERTQEAYLGAVAGLARHYQRSPDTLSAEEVQRYLLHLLRERQLSRSSVNQAGCAFRFLYASVLGLNGEAFQIPLGRAPQKLPEILSREELARLFAVARHAKARTFLMLAYGTGLRLTELCRLRVADIDSHSAASGRFARTLGLTPQAMRSQSALNTKRYEDGRSSNLCDALFGGVPDVSTEGHTQGPYEGRG